MAGMTGFEHIQEWPQGADGPHVGVVLVLPGAGYPARLPGLALPIRALTLVGWQVFTAVWDLSGMARDEARQQVDAALAAFEQEHGLPDLLLAKSVGTLAARWAADHAVPAVWTTPLLGDPTCVAALSRATAPALLVGGDADPLWDDEAAGGTGLPTHTVRGADHGWCTGDWRQEVAVLDELTDQVAAFAASQRPASGSGPVGHLTQVVLECADPHALAAFWQQVLDLAPPSAHDDWVELRWPDVGRLALHRVDGYVPPAWPGEHGEQQTHFDLLVDDFDRACRRVEQAGARPLGGVINPDSAPWRIYADPAGHPFCLVSTPE